MRILITGTTYAPALNGQSIFTTHLAEGLAGRGHEVWVVSPSNRGEAYLEERNGVQVHWAHATTLNFFHEQAYASLFPDGDARRIMDEFSPEIVHIHDHYPLSHALLNAARRRNIPVMGTNHFVPENLAPYVPLLPKVWPVFNRLLWWWFRQTYNRLALVTGPSRTAVEILKTAGLKVPAYPVSCGVNFAQFHPDAGVNRAEVRRKLGLDEQRVTFLFVGRVDAEKKLDVLIRALKQLNRRDIQLVVTGRGAALESYRQLAGELDLLDVVRFTGFVSNEELNGLLNSVDIFTMPSEAELLSIASLEAMAAGRPLLLAAAKALPELVDHGRNGYLFKAGDVADAARCMALLADHPEQWAAMGAASLEKVQPHRLESVFECYEELYRACMTGRG